MNAQHAPSVVICGNREDQPLLAVGPFDTEEDAITFANDHTHAYRTKAVVAIMTAKEYEERP